MLCPDIFWQCILHKWMWWIISPCLLAIGTIGNIFSVLMFSRRALRQYSTSVLLILLAASDTLFLWSTVIDFTLRNFSGIYITRSSDFVCKTFTWIAFSSGAFSAWTITNLSIERFLFTKFPLRAKIRLTPSLAVKISVVTLVVVQMQTFHLLFGLKLKQKNVAQSAGENVTNVSNIDTASICGFVSISYKDFYLSIWQYVVLISFNILPFVMIFLSNCTIAYTVWKMQHKIKPASINNTNNVRRDRSVIKMLFFVSFFYVLCTSPYCLYQVLVHPEYFVVQTRLEASKILIQTILLLLLYSNFTFNFVLYFISGTLFKKEWKKMIQSFKKKIEKGKNNVNQHQTQTLTVV